MELDKALEFAVILAWEDLMKVTDPCSARVEYRCEPGTSLDYLSVWSVDAEGHRIGCATTGRDFSGSPQWDTFQQQIPV